MRVNNSLLATIATVSVLLAVNILFIPGLVCDELHLSVAVFVGLAGVILAWRDITPIALYVLLPAWVAAVTIPAGYVPGYTAYQFVALFGVLCLALISVRAGTMAIMRVLMLTVFVHLAFNYLFSIPWRENCGHAYTWGIFRHHIRYSTALFIGVMASWYILINCKIKARKVVASIAIIGGSASIIHAHSNTIMAFLALATVLMVFRMGYPKTSVLLLAAIIAAAAIWKPTGYGAIDWQTRFDISKHCFDNQNIWTVLLGHGLGSWQTQISDMHAHNELANVFYTQGILGIAAWMHVIVYGAMGAMRDGALFVLFLLLTASVLTNSWWYPEVMSTWAILLGVCIKPFDGAHCEAIA